MTQEHIDFMLSKIPHRPLRRDRRDRLAGLLAGQRGMQLLHRRRVRHLRRPRDLLNRGTRHGSARRSASRRRSQLAEMIRTKQLSPVEVMTALLARIEALDPQVNAFAYLAADAAMDAAKRAEAALMQRRAHRPAARRAGHDQGPGDHQGHADADAAARSSPAISRPRTRRSCRACATKARSSSARPRRRSSAGPA